MNIFVLECSPHGTIDWKRSAEALDNKRIGKMIVESLQLLSTACRTMGIDVGYKATHRNHPCAVWVRESSANYRELLHYVYFLTAEYKRRFNKAHSGEKTWLELAKIYLTDRLPYFNHDLTLPPLAVSKEYRRECRSVLDLVSAYRGYYTSKENMYYDQDDIPEWFAQERTKAFRVRIGKLYYSIEERSAARSCSARSHGVIHDEEGGEDVSAL